MAEITALVISRETVAGARKLIEMREERIDTLVEKCALKAALHAAPLNREEPQAELRLRQALPQLFNPLVGNLWRCGCWC